MNLKSKQHNHRLEGREEVESRASSSTIPPFPLFLSLSDAIRANREIGESLGLLHLIYAHLCFESPPRFRVILFIIFCGFFLALDSNSDSHSFPYL